MTFLENELERQLVEIRAERDHLRTGLNLILDGAAGCYGSENMPKSVGDVLTEIHRLLFSEPPRCRCKHREIEHKHDGTACYALIGGSGCEIRVCSCREYTPVSEESQEQ